MESVKVMTGSATSGEGGILKSIDTTQIYLDKIRKNLDAVGNLEECLKRTDRINKDLEKFKNAQIHNFKYYQSIATIMELTQYEKEALGETLKKSIETLEDQVKALKKIKHSTAVTKKEIQRNLEKKINLLTRILKKL